ncbi:MAG: 6-phosphofructokinase, partial [Bacillota bacterium]
EVCQKIKGGYERGKLHSIILVAEGVDKDFDSQKQDHDKKKVFAIADEITERTGLETRVTVLGHLQRGGTPTAQDRILGSRLGAEAVKLLLSGETNQMVGMIHKQVKSFPIAEALDSSKELDQEIHELANILSL